MGEALSPTIRPSAPSSSLCLPPSPSGEPAAPLCP
eukprot:CAMPEP_0194731818 /NCGR_PEP_ID=MMETSP0296-20130528/58901_1 /TAXON_ID=39354 /ORGANISM="Heterosigma akashiwo, Strain CCMP2393" /LENGTH=34 /DNA_ID= /DNA_START= /DNA_END= /DNA_ORIENTATION=